MRFGVDVQFAVKDVEAVVAKKAGKRRPLSAPTNTTTKVTAAAGTVTASKQPKTSSMQTHIKAPSPKQSEHISLIEQYKPQLGRKQQSSGAPPLPVYNVTARGTNKALKEEETDPIEPEPMKMPSKYPIKITSNVSSSLSNKTRIDPKTKWTEDPSSAAAAVRWDINVICEDRDLLLLAQDCKISEYNLKHHILLSSQVKPEARLIASDRRVELRDKRLGVGRERIEHFSVGKVINDPMPFYPFLHEGAYSSSCSCSLSYSICIA
jgi:hypothetical protein